jgi:hypothetical protein
MTTIEQLINDFAIAIKDLKQSHDKLNRLNIYINPEDVDLIISEFIAQYDLLLTEQQCDYLRCL